MAQRLDSAGNVVSSSAYDAYGGESSTSTPTDPFGYHARDGYVLDRETGLYLCGHRYYDPAAGRWATRDPIGYGGGVNLYGYCAGGPVGNADPSGLFVDKTEVGLLEAADAGDEAADQAADRLLLRAGQAARDAGDILGDGLPVPPDTGAKDPDCDDTPIYRRGTSFESAERLTRGSERSQRESSHGYYGVSASTTYEPGTSASTKGALEAGGFAVKDTPTPWDPGHKTVVMPYGPVDEALAARFNALFGRFRGRKFDVGKRSSPVDDMQHYRL